MNIFIKNKISVNSESVQKWTDWLIVFPGEINNNLGDHESSLF